MLRGSFTTMTAVAALMILQRPALAGPTGGTVVAGSGSISQSGQTTNVNQASQTMVLNWQTYSIRPNETVNYFQPNASALAVNRVIGNETSIIAGALNANGRVFLINSAGVVFTKGSQVNVGGLVASTLDISNADAMAGKYHFSGTSAASVINRGHITARPGGYVALLGKTVSNQGVISARLGTVAMTAGDKVTLNFAGNSLFDVTIDKGTLNALVENKRAIRADGGQVIMTAKAADEVLSAQVNNSGIVQARTIASLTGGSTAQAHVGKIKIVADGGTANISGKLDASAPKGGDGGFIETSGSKVKIADNAVITTRSAAGKTGIWLVDPTDFTIFAGSGAQTASGIGATTLVTNLGNNNVTLTTSADGGGKGDINVNAALDWTANTTLTLNAANNININAPITIRGASGGLALNYGGWNGTNVTTPAAGTGYNILTPASYSGAAVASNGLPYARPDTSGGVYGSVTFKDSSNLHGLSIAGNTYTLVYSMADLANPSTITGNFALAGNLDAGGTTYTAAVVNTLSGTFTGLGHTISNLTINAPVTSNIGLFGRTLAGSAIRDIGLTNANITGRGTVATLLGQGANATTVSNAYATGSVTATASNGAGGVATGLGANAGGLVGQLQGGSVTASYANVPVTGFGNAGGLIGSATSATVTNAHATGSVTGASNNVGGLVGAANSTTVSNTYAYGDVTGGGNITGGLIGLLSNGSGLTRSFATGDVTVGATGQQVGGLVGQNNGGAISYVYATGDVSGRLQVGGLIGFNTINSLTQQGGTIGSSYASGNVTAVEVGGGFAGQSSPGTTITGSYATGKVTGGVGGITGGFIGSNFGLLNGVYATGAVTASGTAAGGLAGLNQGTGTIRDSYATGSVNGINSAGGLIGENVGTVTGSHAHGNVTCNTDCGGLIGLQGPDINGGVATNREVSGNYATGKVNGAANVGGLFGRFIGGTGFNNYWDVGASGQSSGIGNQVNNGIGSSDAKGLKTRQVRDIGLYANGTIGQVLAVRATGAQTGSTVSTSTGLDMVSPLGAASAARNNRNEVSGSIENNIRNEQQRERSRTVSANTDRGVRRGGNFGATIRSINVEGQRFNLRNNNPVPAGDAGGNTTPAGGTPARP